MGILRILARYELKMSNNEDSLDNLLFIIETFFQKSVCNFFEEWSVVAKSAVTFEKCPLVEELKSKIQKSTIFSHFYFQL